MQHLTLLEEDSLTVEVDKNTRRLAMIRIKQKGDFSKATHYFKRVKKASKVDNLDSYGKKGVEALAKATPIKTGKTAESWYYTITKTKDVTKISFNNSNIQNGVPIAIILQYGHGTNNGGWVQGRDYINPAIQPLFDELAKDAWKEVTMV